MKKRIFTIIMVFSLLCTMCISASAASKTGETAPMGTSGILTTSARLIISLIQAEALTTSGSDDLSILRTTVNYTYTNTMDQTATMSASGYSAAIVAPDNMHIVQSQVSATSHHSVLGGSEWGNWYCSLYESR